MSTVMSVRVQELLTRFQESNRSFREFVETLPEDVWDQDCLGERKVRVLAHHIAIAYPVASDLVTSVAAGGPIWFTPAIVDEYNAKHAKEQTGCTREDVLELLRVNAETARQAIAGLTDEQLDRSQPNPMLGGGPSRVQDIVEYNLIGHAFEHRASIEAVLRRSS